MENILPRIGVVPNQFWPNPTDDCHALLVHTRDDRLKVTLEVFAKSSRTPLRVNPTFDNFIYIAEGRFDIISPNFCGRIKPKTGIIIRANHPHGFLVGDDGAKIINISMGDVDAAEHQLPHSIQNQFTSIADNLEAVKLFQPEIKWKDLYSQFEIQTTQWVKHELVKSLETGAEKPFKFCLCKDKVSPMYGWQLPNAFILKTRGLAIGFKHETDNGEYIKINRVFAFGIGLNRTDRKIKILK
jgi:hypothetical protein